MISKRNLLLSATAIAAVAFLGPSVTIITQANAQEVLKTGGQQGDYYQVFAPPVAKLLNSVTNKELIEVTIDTSDGTPASMDYLLSHPTSYALAQGNIYADLIRDPRYQNQFQILSSAVGNEVVVGVLSERLFTLSHGSWGAIARNAQNVKFAISSLSSGPGRTFQQLMALDPQNLGKAQHVEVFNNVDNALQAITAGRDDVSLFVQFPNRNNPRFRYINDPNNHLHIVPIIMPQMKALKLPGLDPDQAFQLCQGAEVGPDQTIDTACSPILIITGAANATPGLVQAFHDISPAAFTPKEAGFAALWRKLKRASTSAWSDAAQKADQLAARIGDKM